MEIPEEQVAALHALAARRGLRGYSMLVREAIEFYLRHSGEARKVRDELLRRRGSWTAEEAGRVRRAIAELRRWTRTER